MGSLQWSIGPDVKCRPDKETSRINQPWYGTATMIPNEPRDPYPIRWGPNTYWGLYRIRYGALEQNFLLFQSSSRYSTRKTMLEIWSSPTGKIILQHQHHPRIRLSSAWRLSRIKEKKGLGENYVSEHFNVSSTRERQLLTAFNLLISLFSEFFWASLVMSFTREAYLWRLSETLVDNWAADKFSQWIVNS